MYILRVNIAINPIQINSTQNELRVTSIEDLIILFVLINLNNIADVWFYISANWSA